jgi:hypothetical protein
MDGKEGLKISQRVFSKNRRGKSPASPQDFKPLPTALPFSHHFQCQVPMPMRQAKKAVLA